MYDLEFICIPSQNRVLIRDGGERGVMSFYDHQFDEICRSLGPIRLNHHDHLPRCGDLIDCLANLYSWGRGRGGGSIWKEGGRSTHSPRDAMFWPPERERKLSYGLLSEARVIKIQFLECVLRLC